MEKVIAASFKVESEAYQAITELRKTPFTDSYVVSQAVLIKKEDGALKVLDSFDTGAETANDTLIGGLVGSFVGILGGPIGVLLGASVGVLTGSALDAGDALLNMTLLEKVAERLEEGQPAVLALEQSAKADAAQKMFAKFDVTIFEEDAAVVMEEIEDAKKAEIELKREAHAKMRESKKAERKQKIEQNRAKIAADFDSLKAKFKKK